jgi:stage V sporulation protein R
LETIDKECARVAKSFGLDTYPNQIEIISSAQMMDAYSTIGMPVWYNHWSYGKNRVADEKKYKRGEMGLAYEIVINSNPCIAYCMEENTLAMQALVIAHASYGHNSFFKNNYLFQEWTDAEGIIDYLLFAKNYVAQCEQKHGVQEVELFLDSCHALQNFGVDRYKRPGKLSLQREQERQKERSEYAQSQVNDLWNKTIPNKSSVKDNSRIKGSGNLDEPQENILYFLEKNSPNLETWQRELIRIVRKIAQYMYPQRQTQVMNEGWATFWHYTILNKLYDEDVLGDGHMLEILKSHTGVTHQQPMRQMNPYALGFAIYSDIRRMCEHPTDEDREWFPDIAGKDWLEQLDFAMRNFKDESFILQYLSPKVMRDFHLFSVLDHSNHDKYKISAIHDEDGYREIRQKLSQQYSLMNMEPNIQVTGVDWRGDRTLTLRYTQARDRGLNSHKNEVMRHLCRIWGFSVGMETRDVDGNWLCEILFSSVIDLDDQD